MSRPSDYIVRIYRRARRDPRLLVGTVEQVGKPERRAFGSLDELWSILLTRRRPASGTSRSRGKPRARHGTRSS